MIQKIRYPQPYKEVPQWMNLNGTWEFSFDTPAYDRTIEVPYPWGSPLSGISEEKDGTAYLPPQRTVESGKRPYFPAFRRSGLYLYRNRQWKGTRFPQGRLYAFLL